MPERSSTPATRITLVFGFIAFAVIAATSFFFIPPKARPTPSAPPSPSVSTPPLSTTSTPTVTEPQAPTSSAPSTEQNDNLFTTSTHRLGETVRFFLRDDHLFPTASSSIAVTATEFTDSRCPAGVQCIWAGERGVRFHLTDQSTGETQDLQLGTVRATTGTALGLVFTLKEIVDAEGGTYADTAVTSAIAP